MDKVSKPQQKPREIPVVNPHEITQDVTAKQLETMTEMKRYKHVVDPSSFFACPYGYSDYDPEEATMVQLIQENHDNLDAENVQNLIDLVS